MDFGSHLAILEVRPMLRPATGVNQGGIDQPQVFLRPPRLGRRQFRASRAGITASKAAGERTLLASAKCRAASRLDATTFQRRGMSRQHRFDIPQSVRLDQLSRYQRGRDATGHPGCGALCPSVGSATVRSNTAHGRCCKSRENNVAWTGMALLSFGTRTSAKTSSP